VNFQDVSDSAREEAVRRWRDSGGLPWFVSAISKTRHGDAAEAELLEAARAVPNDSPAWAMAAHHRARLLIEAERLDEARELLDAALGTVARVGPPSAENHLRAQRFRLAVSFGEFVDNAERTVSGVGFVGLPSQMARPRAEDDPPAQLDADAVAAINHGLPLSLLVRLAGDERLRSETRREIAIAAYAQALLLEDYDAAGRLAPVVGVNEEVTDLFSAALVFLRHPGIRPYLMPGRYVRKDLAKIDDFRDNWWGRVGDRMVSDVAEVAAMRTGPGGTSPARPEPLAPGFLDEGQRAAVRNARELLLAFPVGPNLLGMAVTSHAREHPEDGRVPEALHLVVRATRYGVTDEGTSAVSRAAFQILHRRYGDSEWAEKTPYWF
jgi:hypothetical protein